MVIAIDGRSGAGKSALARELSHDLGAHVLHLDDIYHGWTGLAATPPTLVHDILQPLAHGRIGRTPRWEWGAAAPGPDLEVPPTPHLILDGCGSGARIIRPYLSYLIWMDGPAAVRRSRVEQRDGATTAAWWDLWATQEDELLATENTRHAADLVLDQDLGAT